MWMQLQNWLPRWHFTGSRIAAAALIALSGPVSAAPLTEEELAARERQIQPKEGTTKISWDRFIQRFPYIAYFEHYDTNFVAWKAASEKERQERASAPDADRPATARETPESRLASNASGVANFGAAIADTMKGGLAPGATSSTTGNALVGAAIAFDVLSWLAKDNTDANLRYQSLKQLRSPSLYLFRFDPTLTTEEAVYQEIRDGQELIEAFGIGCVPAVYHEDVPFTRGYIAPGWVRVRKYACGFATGEELGFFGRVREAREYGVYQLASRPPLVMMRFEKLDEMERMPQILALEKSQMGSAGKILYQKIGPTLDSKWTAVFTALGEDGEWHAYAVREGLLVEFAPVPKR